MIKTSVLAAGANGHQTSSEEINAFATDFIAPGVVGTFTSTTGAYVLAATGNSTSITVGTGAAWVSATPNSQGTQTLRVYNDTPVTLPISANTTGATRYDWVYIKIDPAKAASPDLLADDVASIYVSRSTSNAVDNGTPATYGLVLGVVTVAPNFATITQGNIADKRTQSGLSTSRKTITVKGQNVGLGLPNAWKDFVVTFPNGQTMPDVNYAVAVTLNGEYNIPDMGEGDSRLQPLFIVFNETTTGFTLRYFQTYASSAISCVISYTATQAS